MKLRALTIPASDESFLANLSVMVRFQKRFLPLHRSSLAIFLGSCWLLTFWVGAVEAQGVQTGHYAPGWNGNLKAGVMARDPGFYMQSTTMFFNARKFKDGSGDTVSDDTTDYVLTALALVWRPDFKLFGADYQAVVTPAFGNLSGLPVLVDGEPQDAPAGLTDMFFSPIGLGWHWSEFDLVAALGGFAPTGKFDLGGNDNTGLGFWTAMPFALGTYRTERGIFADLPLLATGGLFYEIHSNQEGHDFRPGDSFTFEWSLGLEFSERTSFGLSGYLYRQVNDPSGSDAAPVDKYRSNGIGLTFSHVIDSVTLNFRAYQDFDVRNGPEGTLAYFDIAWGWPK
jgi:hypothetical protein